MTRISFTSSRLMKKPPNNINGIISTGTKAMAVYNLAMIVE